MTTITFSFEDAWVGMMLMAFYDMVIEDSESTCAILHGGAVADTVGEALVRIENSNPDDYKFLGLAGMVANIYRNSQKPPQTPDGKYWISPDVHAVPKEMGG